VVEIYSKLPDTCLEIGVVNKFTANYLTHLGVDVITVDRFRDVCPDVVGSITNLPFKNNSVDVVSAFEVLEHLEYCHFVPSLREMARISRRDVIISIPDQSMSVDMLCYHLKNKVCKRNVSEILKEKVIPQTNTERSHHYWELGDREHPLEKIVADIKTAGLNVEKTYRVKGYPYHRYLILSK